MRGWIKMLYNLASALVRVFMLLVFRVKVINKENFPKDGPVIVSINHTSYWDVPLVAAFMPRKLHYMAKRDLFKIPVLGSFMKWVGAFPVSRGKGDIGAIKTALDVLSQDKVVAIFPEGRRVLKGMPHSAKPGIALIAEKSGAPILPVAIGGKYRLFAKIPITVGEPIYVDAPEQGHLSTEELKSISGGVVNTILQMAGEC
jgi:1-acyl-sn-glycerol-3-phosphate acyltransferase